MHSGCLRTKLSYINELDMHRQFGFGLYIIIRIFLAVNYFLNYILDVIYLNSSGCAIAQLPPPLDILLEYWIEYVTFGLLCVMCTFLTRIFYRGVPGFATDCPCGVWCRGLTTCLLYVGPIFGNLFENDSRFVSMTKEKTCFLLFLLFHILIP